MEKSAQQIAIEDDERYFKQMKEAQKRNAAAKDFYGAAISAKLSLKSDDLLPYRNEDGEPTYSANQGAKAACFAREEVSSILQLQLPILERLDGIDSLVKVCLVVLIYIAYKVT